jgi:methyltransferase-like protein/2-polyprenyl-3-methyl-5-hydroxy-6-metoxy-1,4-benzoquinol methylase
MATKKPSPPAAPVPGPAKTPAVDAAIDAPMDPVAAAYNTVPYHSKPFAQSAPEQMAVMARLFKLEPPPLATARVLELGCSAGGNIIPLATRYPGVHAVGIDLSSVEIEQGKAQLEKLGITNCELRCLDIVKAASEITGLYDYIVCHGVFSWVPEPVRKAIMQVIRDKLAPNGVAYVSYNVYPGWKFREVIREMMMFHAGGLQDPAQRVGQAKAILDYIKNNTSEASTYGKMLRDEAAIVSRAEDYYLLHDHLEINNTPMYFRDFVQLAGEHRLAYLGEAYLADMAPQRMGDEVFQTLSRLSAGNILATEQYMDFFTNRTFRQTLLVHQDQSLKVERGLNSASIKGFSISTSMAPDPAFAPQEGKPAIGQFKDNFGRVLTVNAPFALAMMMILAESAPYPVSMTDLAAQCKARVPQLASATDDQLAEALGAEILNLTVQSMLRLHVDPPAQPDPAVNPQAYSMARVQAEMGQNWATNLFHQPVGISAGHRSLLMAMDGKRDFAALQQELVAQFKDGRLSAHRGNDLITDEAELNQVAQGFLRQALPELRRLSLIV